jgi:tetratricopeptide (TPR) repeat protein
MSPRLRDALDWFNGSAEEPLRLLRLIAGGLLLFGTLVAIGLAVSGIAPRALLLVGAFWAIYGLISGFTTGVLEPVVDGLSIALQNVGLMRVGQGYSGIETLAARGHLAEAAEAYRERAQISADRIEATVRRAALLAGPLGQPETALVELQALREQALRPEQDLRVGIALVDIYERRLGDPGRAMVELRRLIDLYPDRRAVRRLRQELALLRADRWPG